MKERGAKRGVRGSQPEISRDIRNTNKSRKKRVLERIEGHVTHIDYNHSDVESDVEREKEGDQDDDEERNEESDNQSSVENNNSDDENNSSLSNNGNTSPPPSPAKRRRGEISVKGAHQPLMKKLTTGYSKEDVEFLRRKKAYFENVVDKYTLKIV